MRNLIRFILDNLYLITFILIQIFAFFLIFSSNSYQRSVFFNSSNAVSGALQTKISEISSYFKLKRVNDSLISENERLMNKLEKYRREIIPPIVASEFSYISAKVVGISVNKIDNFITINKGKKHGVYNEMGVLGPNGIVGIVISVSDNYSTILPLINPNSRVSVKLSKNNYSGSLSWLTNEVNYGIVNEIPGYVDLEIGDQIVTSGLSAIFPENLPVGYVVDYEIDNSTRFYKIKVKYYTDFYNLNYVYLINNKNFNEIKEIMEVNNLRND